jgi:hypothetical protein
MAGGRRREGDREAAAGLFALVLFGSAHCVSAPGHVVGDGPTRKDKQLMVTMVWMLRVSLSMGECAGRSEQLQRAGW